MKHEIKDFLIMRCYELIEVRGLLDKNVEDYYFGYEIKDKNINIFMGNDHSYPWFQLPLDIVFDPGFKTKLTERVTEERRLSELRRIDATRIQEEVKKAEKVKMMRELMKEFPDEVSNHIQN